MAYKQGVNQITINDKMETLLLNIYSYNKLLIQLIFMQKRQSKPSQSDREPKITLTESEQIESMLNMADISDIIPAEATQQLAQIKRLEGELAESEKNVEMKDRQLEALRRTSRTLENHLQMQKRRITTLEQRNLSLEMQVKSFKEKFGSSIISEQSTIRTNDLKDKFNSLESQYNRMKKNYENLALESEENKYNLEKIKKEKQNLNEKANNSVNLLNNKIKQITELQTIIKRLQSENKLIASKLESRAEVKPDRSQILKLEQKNLLMGKQLNQIKQELNIEKIKSNDLQKRKITLENQLKESNSVKQNLKQKNKNLEQKLKRIQSLQKPQQIDHQQSNIVELELDEQPNADDSQEIFDLFSSKHKKISQKIKDYAATNIDCCKQRIRFLNMVIANAEDQLEKLSQSQ